MTITRDARGYWVIVGERRVGPFTTEGKAAVFAMLGIGRPDGDRGEEGA